MHAATEEKDLTPGLYEAVLTLELEERVRLAKELQAAMEEMDEAEVHVILARHLHSEIERALKGMPSDQKTARQITLANDIVTLIERHTSGSPSGEGRVQSKVLREVRPKGNWTSRDATPRPGIPLSESQLLVNATGEFRVGFEIAREIASADRIDMLLSFIKWSGIRVLEEELKAARLRGVQIRVITTVYMGATQQRALDFLVDKGAEVRVSYDTRRTRLHAKAWLFHRKTGFSTAYIGSSNLSASAQVHGLEWNVRVSAIDAPRILQKFNATFETYWHDDEFVSYTGIPADVSTFRSAIAQERSPDSISIGFFDITPHSFQKEILERLEVERSVHDRHKNLIVAATGTGKTIVAALDYKRMVGKGKQPSLLFVAHRKEILQQSRRVFRNVLRDGSFGEMYVDGERPRDGVHVFASVQSLANLPLKDIDASSWDVVIVDEFHHAEARTYRRLLEHLRPKELLGLTATPERTDGADVREWFDGRTAYELRLWDAIDLGQLVPFQYFGVHDNVDISALTWRRGSYDDSELEDVYTASDFRVNLILKAVKDKVTEPLSMKALGFCVGVRHAAFMAAKFTEAGLPAIALTGSSSREDRATAISRLRRGEICTIFVVDLFNEGVDIPEVDTIFFLRPTNSATVFLQQLGRGLRTNDGKECLTVLDFIGQARREYRFDLKFRAITGATRRQVERQVEQGFPLLPSGCTLQLDRASREVVLENIKRAVGSRRSQLVEELVRLGPDTSLAVFLGETGLEVEEVYRGGRSYSDLRRAANFRVPAAGPKEDVLARGIVRLLHVDEPRRLAVYSELLSHTDAESFLRQLSEDDRRRVIMLMVTLFGESAAGNIADTVSLFFKHPAIVQEISELLPILGERITHVPRRADVIPEEVPLSLHCSYSLDDVMSAFGDVRNGKLYRPREGVVYHAPTQANLLFVTLHKSEKDYSPSTMYEDYAVSAQDFHWQSQSRTRPDSEKGRRHWQHRKKQVTPLLFIRERKKTEHGTTSAYLFLGPVSYVEHSGERPMNILWRLATPMPADWLRVAKVAV